MTYISACAAFMLHTVCLTSHCYRDQALLRLSVAVVVLWCVLPCVCVFHCCCCLMVLWSVHMAVVRSWCEGAGGPASGFKFLLGRFVPVYCGAKAGFCGLRNGGGGVPFRLPSPKCPTITMSNDHLGIGPHFVGTHITQVPGFGVERLNGCRNERLGQRALFQRNAKMGSNDNGQRSDTLCTYV